MISAYKGLILLTIVLLASCHPPKKQTDDFSNLDISGLTSDKDIIKLLKEEKKAINAMSSQSSVDQDAFNFGSSQHVSNPPSSLKKTPLPTKRLTPSAGSSINTTNLINWKNALIGKVGETDPANTNENKTKLFQENRFHEDTTVLEANTKEATTSDNSIELSYDGKQFILSEQFESSLLLSEHKDKEGIFHFGLKSSDQEGTHLLFLTEHRFKATTEHLEQIPVAGNYDINNDHTEFWLFVQGELYQLKHGQLRILMMANGIVMGYLTFGPNSENSAVYSAYFQGKIEVVCPPIYKDRYCKGWTKF